MCQQMCVYVHNDISPCACACMSLCVYVCVCVCTDAYAHMCTFKWGGGEC